MAYMQLYLYGICNNTNSIIYNNTTDRAGTGGTLLSIKVAEAGEAVREIISRSKALASQLLLAA